METKLEKFNQLRRFLFKTLLIFFFGGGSLLLAIALSQFFAPNHQSVFLQVTFIILGLFILLNGLGFLFCLPILFFKWLVVRKEIVKTEKRKKIKFYVGLGFAVLSVVFIILINYFHFDAKKCDDAECFINLAQKCEAVKWQTVDGAGMEWQYYSSPYCRFEKQLLAITGSESKEMKNILQNQSLTCNYQSNKFHPLWVSSLIFDLEPCNGELKESISKLLLLL